MAGLVDVLLANALAAGAISLLAWGASRWARQEIAHVLWALALLKLVTPPLTPVPLFPAAITEGQAVALPLPPGVAPLPPPSAEARASRPAGPRMFLGVVTAVALAGTALVLVLGWIRVRRFSRWLSEATAPPAELGDSVLRLAVSLGLRAAPRVQLVPARVSPLLWPGLGGPRLLFPTELLPRLEPEERDALLAHELAHIRRRDHWMRALEMAVTALFWWYPVAWWARRGLRRAEERCCDQWVLRLMPGGGRAYAQALLKTLAFVAEGAPPLPAVASGASPARDLQTRLKEVLTMPPTTLLSRPERATLGILACAGLLVFPVRAQEPPRPDEGDAKPEDIERGRREIESRGQEIQRLHLELERAVKEAQRRERDRLRADAKRLRREGRETEAEEARARAEELGIEGGVAGGVEGGVSGGVVGGVVGGLGRHAEIRAREAERAAEALAMQREVMEHEMARLRAELEMQRGQARQDLEARRATEELHRTELELRRLEREAREKERQLREREQEGPRERREEARADMEAHRAEVERARLRFDSERIRADREHLAAEIEARMGALEQLRRGGPELPTLQEEISRLRSALAALRGERSAGRPGGPPR